MKGPVLQNATLHMIFMIGFDKILYLIKANHEMLALDLSRHCFIFQLQIFIYLFILAFETNEMVIFLF